MKFKFIVFIFCLLCLVGCKKNKPHPAIDYKDDLDAVEEEVLADVPDVMTKEKEFKTTYSEYNAEVEFASDNPDVLDPSGYIIYDRHHAYKVNLTYTITIDDETRCGEKCVVVSPYTPDEIAEKFINQFSVVISRNYDVTTNYYDVFTVEWHSDNVNVFDDEGRYHQPDNDTEITISYVVKFGDMTSEEYNHSVCVIGLGEPTKFKIIKEWLEDDALKDTYITENMQLPVKFERFNAKIVWRSSNNDVINEQGEIRHYVFERYVTLTAEVIFPNEHKEHKFQARFECVVAPLSLVGMSRTEILENALDAIGLSSFGKVKFGYSECPNLSPNFGHLYFYENTDLPVTEMLIPVGTSNRTGRFLDPQMICIHDTANYRATAKQNAAYCQSGYSGQTTGWHYTIGNDGIFQTIPDNECAYHGNGSQDTPLTWLDTGIHAEYRRPQIKFDKEGYIYVAGHKTKYLLPEPNRPFTDYGMLCEIGANGNYLLAKPWFSRSNGSNATMGANASSIGIETAVNGGADYNLTVRYIAKFVAKKLAEFNLSIDRVIQHNTTSGKNCPQAIRQASYWFTLKDLIATEMFLKKNFPDCDFTWHSETTGLLDNGVILDDISASEVKYSVKVTEGENEIFTKSYTTKLIK